MLANIEHENYSCNVLMLHNVSTTTKVAAGLDFGNYVLTFCFSKSSTFEIKSLSSTIF
jgi:hypothetical protein